MGKKIPTQVFILSMKKYTVSTFLIIVMLLITSCEPKLKTPLIVFAAGSLIQPFSNLEKAFEAKYPSIDVISEYHGSIQVMRHVTELHEEIDVVASADQALIPMLMYQINIPGTQTPYTNWFIRMASNQLNIAYTPDSKYANEINARNWWEVLSRPDVRVGLSDPRFDAVGYRTLMQLSLAKDYYQNNDIFANFVSGQFKYPIKLTDNGDMQIILVPEVLETARDSHILMRGSSIALISLLEAGEVDYTFEYASVIEQHGFEMLSLPDELNMGNEAFNDFYGKAIVKMDFQRFASVNPVFQGEQIKYGITIPANAPHADEAALFIKFIFSPEGQAIMQKNSHPLILPVQFDQPENLPDSLKDLR